MALRRLWNWTAKAWVARTLGLVITAVGGFAMLQSRLAQDPAHWLLDLQVYQGAGAAIRDGHGLYAYLSPWPQRLPFTYPPFGGLLAVPLSLLSRYPLGITWTVVELAVAAWLTRRFFRPLLARAGSRAPALFGALYVGFLWLTPVRDTFYYGQVNLFLMGLVVVDLTVMRGRWPRGIFVGIAAAIKLTPGLFIPYLWITGRRRAAVVAAATFVGAQLVALAFLPSDTVTYWTSTVFEGERLGLNAGAANQSIRGMVLRLALPATAGSLLWVVLAAPVAVIGLRRAKRAYDDGDALFSLGLVGLTAALVSPVSWIHHFLWIAAIVAAVVGDGRDRRRLRWAAGLLAAFWLHWPWFGRGLIDGAGSYVLGRVLQESYLVLTLWVVSALPWRRHIFASIDVALPGSGHPVLDSGATPDGEAGVHRPVVTS